MLQAAPDSLPGFAGFVLAGGRSVRMGRDKALLTLEGRPLIVRALHSLESVCAEVAIAGAASDLTQFGRVVPDLLPGSGPLGGIVSALAGTRYEWNLFLAVDVPYVPELAWRRIRGVAESGQSPIVMAASGGYVHPLCAAFNRSTLPALRRELEAGHLKLKLAAAAAGAITYVPFEEHSWFRNFNTPEEFSESSIPGSIQ